MLEKKTKRKKFRGKYIKKLGKKAGKINTNKRKENKDGTQVNKIGNK